MFFINNLKLSSKNGLKPFVYFPWKHYKTLLKSCVQYLRTINNDDKKERSA